MLTDCIKRVIAFLLGFDIPEEYMREAEKGLDRLGKIYYGKNFVSLSPTNQRTVLCVEDTIRRTSALIDDNSLTKEFINKQNVALVIFICAIMVNDIFHDAKDYSMRYIQQELRIARYAIVNRKKYIEAIYGFILNAEDAYSTPTEGGPQGWMMGNWFINARSAALDERPFNWVSFINDLGNDPAERFECSVRELWMLASEKAYESEAKEAITA